MEGIGALQESLTVTNTNQQMSKAKLRMRFLKKHRIRNSTRVLCIERSTRQGQREERRALHILSVAAASRSSLLKKIVGRRMNN